MSTYEELIGKRVEFFDSDPTLTTAYEGQVWYNTTSDTLKTVVAKSAFSSSANMITARSSLAGFGIQTAAVGAGGYITAAVANVEEYNGSGFSNATAIPTATNSLAGFGVLTAGVVCGGVSGSPTRPNATFEYNGTSWTGGGTLNTGRQDLVGVGVETAGLVFGSSNPNSNLVEEYNGSAWTAVNAMNRPSINNMAAGGVQTAAYGAGGYIPGTGNSNATENYDGTNWTTSGNIPAARRASRGSGTQTDGIMAGGNGPGITAVTLNYDGTTWSTNPATLSTAREAMFSSQNAPASTTLIAGGYDGSGRSSLSEEFNKSVTTVVAAAWTSGGNMNSGRTASAGFANKNDLVIAGGFISTPSPADDDSQNLVEEYNGSTWTAVTAMPSKRTNASGCGASQTSGMVSGGIHANQTTSVEYDGTNWTSGGDIPAVSRMAAHCGTVPAALRCGGAGNPGPALNQTIEYDGSSWTAVNNMPHTEYGHMLVGTQTAAVFSGGHNAPTRDNLYEYDGTNWTTSPATLAVSINNNAGAAANGTQTAAMWMGGQPAVTASQVYDGTSVITQPSLGSGRYNVNNGGGGTSTAAIVGGGQGDSDATEQFTAETTSVVASTLTTS